MLKELYDAWRHGAVMIVVYGLTVFGFFTLLAIAAFLVNAILHGLGRGTDDETLINGVWRPVALGLAAKISPSEKLRPDSTSEPLL